MHSFYEITNAFVTHVHKENYNRQKQAKNIN